LTFLLWSIWCELIYYALYPILRILFARFSVFAVLIFSFAVATGVIVYTLTTQTWQGLFNAGNLTWLAGMPCWILGCQLAERFASARGGVPATAKTVWSYRAAAAGLGFASCLAMLHLHVSFLISLQLFAVFAYFWIRSEIKWHLEKPANRYFEMLGSFTFSIYLMHMLAKSVWESMTHSRGLSMWAVEVGFILFVSAVFYGLVERPSHLLARVLSRSSEGRGIPVLSETEKARQDSIAVSGL
jgi:peptidoglycan/LPS O-acetylase OafA/YrhL